MSLFSPRVLQSAFRQAGRIVYRGLADAHSMPLTFACPAKAQCALTELQLQVFYNSSNVKQVDVSTMSGSFGILPTHVPVLAMLQPSVLTVFEEDGSPKKFFVSSGSVTVNNDGSVQILSEEACTLEDLDTQACKETLSEAQKELNSAADESARAEAQIKVEVGEALVRAAEHGI